MKKTHLFIFLIFLLSCKKENKPQVSPDPAPSAKQEAKITFSKTLAIALEKEPSLRSLLKSEALKQFDKDYDVLLQLILDKKLGTQTVADILFKYASSKEVLKEAIESLPTLTILIPKVPNFTPETWDTSSEIPMVAVAPEGKSFKNVELYNSKLEVTKIPYGLVPGFPVVVVKENERVTIASKSAGLSSKKTSSIMQTPNQNPSENVNQKYDFQFIDAAFDGISKNSTDLNNRSSVSSTQKLANTGINNLPPAGVSVGLFSVDPRVKEAFEKNVEWQRDYIYYGIDPAAGVIKGKFNNRYVEHIVAIKINVPESSLSDSPEDPTSVDSYSLPRPPTPNPKLWTDGNFEIRINILINSKAGAGANIEKILSLPGSALYETVYTQQSGTINWHKVSSTPKRYTLPEPVPIVAWDLENFGSQWKFVLSEFDNATTVTNTYVNSTKYATNFQFDIGFGDKVKVGAKFGSSLEESETKTYQIVTTMVSDQLGEGIMQFSDPIILSREDNVPYVYVSPERPPRDNPYGPWFVSRFYTNDISSGSFSLSVEPRYR